MSKRIVVGLDGSPYTDAATDVAVERASRVGGTVVGVAVIDVPGIVQSEAGAGAGSAHYAGELMEQKVTDAHNLTRDFLVRFGNRCREAGVKYELAREEGVPFDVLIEIGRASDLIVVGLRTNFHSEADAKPGDTVARLLRTPVAPVLGVPEKWVSPRNVLIAYSHSIYSARALRAFVHQQSIVPFADNITLLQLTDDAAEVVDKRDLDQAENYLRAYGFNLERRSSGGNAIEVLMEAARELEPCMVVMGVPHTNWLKDIFSDSMTDAFLGESRIPVFVYQ